MLNLEPLERALANLKEQCKEEAPGEAAQSEVDLLHNEIKEWREIAKAVCNGEHGAVLQLCDFLETRDEEYGYDPGD